MGVTVTLADGSARESAQTWADGVSDCPWCQYPMFGGSCGNPACDVQLDAAGLAARRAEQQQRAEAAEREASWRRYETAQRAEREAARDALWAELSAKAEAAGQCVKCLRRSYWGNSPKFIRHRDAGSCPNARR